MKKNILLITLIVLLGCFMFVSCDSEAVAPQTDELVKVAFVESTSKALTQNIPAFDVASHYWKYTAVKKDGSTLTTGATGPTHDVAQAQWVALDSNNSPKQGLSENNTPYQVINFSRGLWEFKLYGYSDAEGEKLVYTGTSSTVALTQDYHQVSVNVSRDKTSGNGTLVINKNITINNASETPYTNLSSAVVRTYEIKKYNSSHEQYEVLDPSVTGTLGSEDVTIENLAAGDYQITITYADSTYTYGSGSANFVIYSNVTTTITGSVSETTTYAEFEATSNVINETASSKSFNSGTTSTTNTVEIKYESSTSTTTEDVVETVTAEVPLTAAKSLLNQVVEANDSIQAETESTSDTTITNEMVLTLAVSTESSTETSATYNIDMNYVLTNTVSTTGSNDVVTQVNGQVSTLDDYTTVMVKLPANLENVQFLHSNLTMKKTNSGTAIDSLTVLNAIGSTVDADENDVDGVYPGYMWYDATTGSAYLRTRSFSPFSVTYDVPSYVAAIGTTFYTTLQSAFDAAVNGDTVVLLTNISLSNVIDITKTITLDLNGKTITVSGLTSETGYYPFRVYGATLNVQDGRIVVAENDETVTGIFRLTNATGETTGNEEINLSGVNINGVFTNNYTTDDANRAGVITSMRAGTPKIRIENCEISYVESATQATNTKTSFISVGPGATISLVDSTLTFTSSAGSYRNFIDGIGNNGNVTISGCTINSNQPGFNTQSAATIIISDIEYWGNPSGSAWISTTLSSAYGAHTIVNSGTFEGQQCVYIWTSGGSMEINGGSFTGTTAVLWASGANNDPNQYDAIITVNAGTFNGKIKAVGTVNQAGSVVINDGTFTNVSFEVSGPNSSIVIYGGTFDADPSAYVADGYYAEHHEAVDQNPEYWVVLSTPDDAPMAKVIRYMFDKSDESEKGKAVITAAEVELLALNSEVDQQKITAIHSLVSENEQEPLFAAVNTGTLVTFMPKFDSTGKTAADLPASDYFYSNGKITGAPRNISFSNENPGWRAEFRIVPVSEFSENEMLSVSIVGSYYGMVRTLGFNDFIPEDNADSIWVMRDSNEFAGLKDFITYDLLLGLCGTNNDTESDAYGVREGFTCGAFTNNPDLYGKTINVQLILTNDNLVGSGDPYTYVVCAEVACTFHAPVIATANEVI